MLQQLSLQDLRSQWRELQGQEPPKSVSPQLLRLAIGYTMQERTHGGLSRQAKLRLKSVSCRSTGQLSTSNSAKRVCGLHSSPQFKPGTRFLREWQGQTHEVTALEDGKFVHAGKTYRSLTAIARSITGTHQSGLIFFGVARRNPENVQR